MHKIASHKYSITSCSHHSKSLSAALINQPKSVVDIRLQEAARTNIRLCSLQISAVRASDAWRFYSVNPCYLQLIGAGGWTSHKIRCSSPGETSCHTSEFSNKDIQKQTKKPLSLKKCLLNPLMKIWVHLNARGLADGKLLDNLTFVASRRNLKYSSAWSLLLPPSKRPKLRIICMYYILPLHLTFREAWEPLNTILLRLHERSGRLRASVHLMHRLRTDELIDYI